VNTSGQVHLNRLVWEGGVAFIAFLLNKAVPLAADQLVFYKDIAGLPSQLREQWKKACQEELEALRKCKVFELANLPPGRKAIKNRWVFMTKSDGRKKARLVAKGFSQIEGIDFDQIFSLVVRYESIHLLLVAAALERWHIECYDFPLDSYLYSHAQPSTVICSLPQWILSQPNLILTHPLVPPDLCLFLLDYTTPAYSLLMTH